MQRTKAITDTYDWLIQLAGPDVVPRNETDPLDVAAQLDIASEAMDPYYAVSTLRKLGQHSEAVLLAHAIPIDSRGAPRRTSVYDALLLAAKVATDELHDPHEALSLLDRAIRFAPDGPSAYEMQILLISELMQQGIDDHSDDAIRRAFAHLPEGTRRSTAHPVTVYLIERAKRLITQGDNELARTILIEANNLAYIWLYDRGSLQWSNIELLLDYGETFQLLGRAAEAKQVLLGVEPSLQRLDVSRQMSSSQLQKYARRLGDLMRRLDDPGW